MELSGKNGGPVAVQAGVNVVIEASTASSRQAAKLTPFFDEREGSPWHGREDLSTDPKAIFSTSKVGLLECSATLLLNKLNPWCRRHLSRIRMILQS
jgi:hypothetical protein